LLENWYENGLTIYIVYCEMLYYVGELGAQPIRFAAKLSVFNVSYKIHFCVRGKNEYFPALGTKIVALQCVI
jgi:hypothetical protein